jgi:hypothetical protein
MKAKLSALVLGIVTASVTTFATPIVITPWPVGNTNYYDMQDFDHYKAYKWKLNLDYFYKNSPNYVPNSTWTVTSGKLEIFNITNNMEPESNDILRANLLDLSTAPVASPNSTIVYTDAQAPSNLFGSANLSRGWSRSTKIGSFSDNNGKTATNNISWVFNTALIDKINDYKSENGWIGIGFDPDCHYTNTGVKLTLDVKSVPVNVPEPSSVGLLLMGLTMIGGISINRKKQA